MTMTTSAQIAGYARPIGPLLRRPGLIPVAALARRKSTRVPRARGGLVRVEDLHLVAAPLVEGVIGTMAGLLSRQAGGAVSAAASAAAKKGYKKLSPAMRKKIAQMGGRAAALKRRLKGGLKKLNKRIAKGAKRFKKTTVGKALVGTGRALAKGAGAVHAAYQTAQAQDAQQRAHGALQKARQGGDKELVRALSLLHKGLKGGDTKSVKRAAAALKLIAQHRAGGGTGPSPHAQRALDAATPGKAAARKAKAPAKAKAAEPSIANVVPLRRARQSA